MNVQLLTPDARGAYLTRIQQDIASAELFVLITAFATSDGIGLLEDSMRACLGAGGQGTLVLALDRQHFNAAAVFRKLAELVEAFPGMLEVRIVREHAGLMHAKAVYAKQKDGSATLLVGSANLTERAFTENHELGLWVNLLGEPDVSRAFQRFAQSLGGTRHSAAELRQLAGCFVSAAPHFGASEITPATVPIGLHDILGEPPLPALPVDTFVGDWLRAGSIVGRGRRGLDVLVIRTPGEQLEHQGLIDRAAKIKLAHATEKTVTAGYGLRLLPDGADERLRKDARRTRTALSKLTLNLPCYGLWMPKSYWDLFQAAASQVRAEGISGDEVRAAAQARRLELDRVGLDREVQAIVADLKNNKLAKPGREDELAAELTSYFEAQLADRTPDVISRAVGFRTQRQSLASELDLRSVARSFFADLVQATFTATYRTGAWPRRFRSFVGRELSTRIAGRCLAGNKKPDNALALSLLDLSVRWEDERVQFENVVAEVNRLLGEPDDFAPVTVEELLRMDQEGGDTDDD